MEYRYSYVIDPSSYDNQGLCNGIPLRVHRNADIEEYATISLRNDWRKHVGPLPLTSYGGNLGPKYNFTAVTLPECRPDRLEIVSYIMEFAFLHDDLVDTAQVDEALALNDTWRDGITEGLDTTSAKGKKSGEGLILRNILKEVTAIDPVRAAELMKFWKRDLDVSRDRKHFRDFDDYMEYRIVDCASYFLIALSTFAMALTIPAEDKDEVFTLTRPVWAAAALTNDVQSWEKEDKLFQKDNATDMTNGVWMLMKQYSIGVEEAKRRILGKAREHVAEFVKTLSQIHNRLDLSLDSRLFVEAMQYMISGNLMWGISTPRYHSDQSLDEMMVARMKYGWPNHREVTKLTSDLENRGTKRTHQDTEGVQSVKRFNGASTKNGINGTNGINGLNGINGSNGVKIKRHKNKEYSGALTKDSDLVLNMDLNGLSSAIICAPADYIGSLPSKGIRDNVADALSIWLDVPAKELNQIKRAINLLHNASLMLDDVQDGSVLRRAQPTTHTVFGPAQTINSAGHQIIQAMNEIRKLGSDDCLDIFSEELEKLYVGQSHDLYWVYNDSCPTIEDYFKMVDYKTGGLFNMLARLMTAKSSSSSSPDLTALVGLLGRYFQIRDDYMNLTSADYTVEKGFCEDLDEGKFSITLLHALSAAPEPEALLLRNLMSGRRNDGKLSVVQKNLALSIIEGARSLEYTAAVLQKLYKAIVRELESTERQFGENKPFRFLLSLLKV
uniref:Phomopsene synthase n=1 Tax=Phomopsis amygdali TaxID=1214568 RepID=A0A7R7TCK1_PHOAM|nr:phomopsene synthase [Diaporthe amygdali]